MRARALDLSRVGAEPGDVLVREREVTIEERKLATHDEGRGVNGVAAKRPEKIGVFLEDEHLHAGAGEQETEHHAGRAAARHATRVALPRLVDRSAQVGTLK